MTDSAHLDRVAEAICRAEPDNAELSDEFVRAVMADYADYYRRVAQAAIDALQLTEQWSVQGECQEGDDCDHFGDHGVWTCSAIADTREEAAAFPVAQQSHSWLVSRLVSIWVRVDGGDA